MRRCGGLLNRPEGHTFHALCNMDFDRFLTTRAIRLLRKYKYPLEGQEEAVGRVIEQPEALADLWTG